MANIVIPSRWSRQPQYAVKPRPYWTSRGLAFLFHGATFTDLVTGAIPTNSGGVTCRANGGTHPWLGPDIASSQYLEFADRDSLDIVGNLSIFWRGTFDVVSGGYRCIVSKTASNGSTATPYDAYIDSASGKVNVWRANAGTRVWVANTTVPTANQVTTIGAMFGATIEGTPTYYVGSVAQSVSNPSGAGTGAPTATSQPLRIGRRVDTSTQLDGAVDCIALFNQTLSAAEYLALYAAPWGELAVPDPRRIYFGAGAGGGANVGSATGTSAATALSGSIAAASGSSVATAVRGSVAVAGGVGTAAAVSGAIGSATGASTASARAGSVGQATGSGAATATSGAIAAAVGTSTVTAYSSAASVASANGTSTATALSGSIGQSTGTSTAAGYSSAASIAQAAGSSSALAIAGFVVTSTAASTAIALSGAIGIAAGTSVANGVSLSGNAGVGNAAGTSAANARSGSIGQSVASSIALGVALTLSVDGPRGGRQYRLRSDGGARPATGNTRRPTN